MFPRNIFLPLFALASVATPAVATGNFCRTEPGPAAQAAYEDFEAGKRAEACEALQEQIHSGSRDPWAYRQAAICANSVEGFQQSFERLIEHGFGRGPLALWGRAYLAYLREDLVHAEELTRQALQKEPQFPIAWNLLGVLLEKKGQVTESIAAYEQALETAPDFEMSRSNLRGVVANRLTSLLSSLKNQPPSSKDLPTAKMDPGAVLTSLYHPSSDSHGPNNAFREAHLLIGKLSARLGKATAWLQEGRVLNFLGLPDHALTVFRWARDEAKSHDDLPTMAYAWIEEGFIQYKDGAFPPASQAFHQAAMIWERLGDSLWGAFALQNQATANLPLGKNKQALELFRRARALYREVDNAKGQGDAWLGEGKALSYMGDYPAALAAYEEARGFYRQLGLLQEEANSWHREAESLVDLAEFEQALEAALQAKLLYGKHGRPAQHGSSWLQEAKIRLAMADVAGARSAVQEARALAPPSKAARENLRRLAHLRKDQGRTFERVGQLRESDPEGEVVWDESQPNLEPEDAGLIHLARAQILFEYLDEASEAAQVGEMIAELYAELGEEELAIVHFEEAARKYELANDLTEAALGWQEAAKIQEGLGQQSSAVDSLDKAASLFSLAGSPELAGEILLQRRAELQLQVGDYHGAVATLQRAQAEFEAVGDGRAIEALTLEVFIRALRGDQEPPVAIQRRKLQEERAALTAAWLIGRANHSIMTGNLQTGIRQLESAAQVASELDDRSSHFKIWVFMTRGRTLIAIPRLREAVLAFRAARQLALSSENHADAAQAWSAECNALTRTGAANEAEACWQGYEAEGFQPVPDQQERIGVLPFDLKITSKTFDNPQEVDQLREKSESLGIDLLSNMATLYRVGELFDRGEVDKALRIFNSVERSELKESDLLLALWHFAAGFVEFAESGYQEPTQIEERDLLAILGHLRSARRLLETSVRRGLVTRAQKAELLSGLPNLNEVLVHALWLTRSPEEVVAEAESGRARTFLDALNRNEATDEGGRGVLADLQEQRAKVEADLADLEEKIRQAGRTEKDVLSEQRRALDRKLDLIRFEELLAEENGSPGASPSSLNAIWQTVDQIGPVVYYYWLGDAVEGAAIGLLLLPGEREIHSTMVMPPGEHPDPVEYIEEANLSLANPIMGAEGVQGYRSILPFPDKLPPDGPLVIIPHGPLHQLPFAALLDEQGVPLGRRYQLTLAPSLSILGNIVRRDGLGEREAPDLAERRALLVASGRGLGLPVDEVREVANLFVPNQTTILDAQQATVDAYRSHAPKARQILIASKAVVVADSQRRSYIELSRADEHDSRLTAAEVASVPIDADLVTLAACDTAHSEPLLNDEHLDLSRAFLLAGSSAVLATRWKVPESYGTSLFLEDFYRIYLAGGPNGDGLRKDEALRQARTLSIERGDPTQIWAAWVLIGEGR